MYFYIENYLFFTKKFMCFNKRNFLRIANVRRGSYIASVVEDKYKRMFAGAVNLKDEYEKYYKIEFSCFSMYLRQRYGLLQGEVEVISNGNFYCSKLSLYKNYFSNDDVDELYVYRGDADADEDVIEVIVKEFLERYT